MNFTVHGPFLASEIFRLEEVRVRAGKPSFANLRARRLAGWKGSPKELRGPGIYGLFCKGKLFYVGLFAGAGANAFGSSVLTRWFKHLTFQSLRAPEITFTASNLDLVINKISGPVGDAFAEVVGGRQDVSAWTNDQSPLIGKKDAGNSTTYHKARFAAQHWEDVFRPGNEGRMLADVSFVYARFDDETAALLEGSEGAVRARWVKKEWLAPREKKLIQKLKPICNSECAEYRDDVDVEAFIEAVREQFNLPLSGFVGGQQEPAPIKPNATTQTVLTGDEALPAYPDETLAENEVDEAEVEESVRSVHEIRFRTPFSEAGEALLDELSENLPPALEIGYTATPDLRVWVHPAGLTQRRVVMILTPRSGGKMRCECMATPEACKLLGITASAVEGATKVRFEFDPADFDASLLFALMGAAAQNIA